MSMTIKQFKLYMKHLPIEQAVLIKGNHGIGKSQVVKQIAEDAKISFIDMRLAQNDVGDLKGLPFQTDGRTYFAPPDWFPLDEGTRKEIALLQNLTKEISSGRFGDKGILFLDELNRATREVQQAAFELVLDRRINMRSLPDGWRVVAAINADSDIYDINEMGPALVSRFAVVELDPSVEEWHRWAVEAGIHPSVRDFCKKYETFLDPSKEVIEAAQGEKVYDRRAWEMFSDNLKNYEAMKKAGETELDIFAKDMVSQEMLLLTAVTHVGNICAVKFRDFVNLEYQSLNADKILNAFDNEVEKRIKELVEGNKIPEVSKYNNMLVDFINNNKIEKLDERQHRNLTKYAHLLNDELVSNFWKSFFKECEPLAREWHKDKKVNKLLEKVYVS